MTLKKQLLVLAVLALLVFTGQAFSQATGLTGISGTVTDITEGVLPGATVTAVNVDTGVELKAVTNNAGVYNFVGLPIGEYRVTVAMTGFQSQSRTGIRVSAGSQIRLNLALELSPIEDLVEIRVDAENILLDSSTSVGRILSQESLAELPLVGGNILNLIKVMGGVNMSDSPIFGADATTFAGLSAVNVNLMRDGVTVSDVRNATGLNSPVHLNPELIGEFKLVLAPVDAELGSGSGQVHVVTRSGSNQYRGSAVWNIENTALDANQWFNKNRRVPLQLTWRNLNQYTLTFGGPIIPNRTFFQASWNQQIYKSRDNNVNIQTLTPLMRMGIFRWLEGYNATGNFVDTPAQRTAGTSMMNPALDWLVDPETGVPRNNLPQPAFVPGAVAGNMSRVFASSVFGTLTPAAQAAVIADPVGFANNPANYGTGIFSHLVNPNLVAGAAFDPNKPRDATGFVNRFLELPPLPNNYEVGDGLNIAGYRWTRSREGVDNVFGIGEGPNRKQFNIRLDHNFTDHRLNANYSYETNRGSDNLRQWPENSFDGYVVRKPSQLSFGVTSTFRPTLLNEFRMGYNYSDNYTEPPLNSPDAPRLRALLNELYPTQNIPEYYNPDIPENIIIVQLPPPHNIAGGSHPIGSSRGNVGTHWGSYDPRLTLSNTMTWTTGAHSFRFGGTWNRTSSDWMQNGTQGFTTASFVWPQTSGGNSAGYINRGIYATGATYTLLGGLDGTGLTSTMGDRMYNMLNLHSAALSNVRQWFFANSPTAMEYNKVQEGENYFRTLFRQSNFNMFINDNWRLTSDLTLTLGLRYEWYGVPFMRNGLTMNVAGGSGAAFGVSGNSFADWQRHPAFNWGQRGQEHVYNGQLTGLEFVGPGSPNPDRMLYNNDNNNFGPAIGFAWQIPWFGRGLTSLRGGYQTQFLPGQRAGTAIAMAAGVQQEFIFTGDQPGAPWHLNNGGQMLLSHLPDILPLEERMAVVAPHFKTPAARPAVSIMERTQTVALYDENQATPYNHNLTLTLARSIGASMNLEVQYQGNLTRKQLRTINLNIPNFYTNGLLEMFDCARYGGNYCTPAIETRFNQMFHGVRLNFPTATMNYGIVGHPQAGRITDGLTQFRAWGATNLMLGNYSALATALDNANISAAMQPATLPDGSANPFIAWQPTGQPVRTQGGLLRFNGFPENFIRTNPQFANVNWQGNMDRSNYHSMQARFTVRATQHLNTTATYVWSRSLGSLTPHDPRLDRRGDYGLTAQHRSHTLRVVGTYDLPFGPNRLLFSGVNPSTWGRVISGWQLSFIHDMQTGRPATAAVTSTVYGRAQMNRVGDFDNKSGYLNWPSGAALGNYWSNEYIYLEDPMCAELHSVVRSTAACTLRAVVHVDDIVRNQAGAITSFTPTFVNARAGQAGNFNPNNMTMPLTWQTDMALNKRVQLVEGRSMSIRIDAVNVFNKALPFVGTPWMSSVRTVSPTAVDVMTTVGSAINSNAGNFAAKGGARTFQATIRFDF